MNEPADLLDAASRKCAMVRFYAEGLPSFVGEAEPGDYPGVAVQAYFEGVVVNTMAAVDQVAIAAIKAWNLRVSSEDQISAPFERLSQRIPEIKAWFAQPIGRDLRRLRTRMVHYSYVKAPDPSRTSWHVESTGANYGGSRELTEFAAAAALYAEYLAVLLPEIAAELAQPAGGPDAS